MMQNNQYDLDKLIEHRMWVDIPSRLESHGMEAREEDVFLQTPLHRMCAIFNPLSFNDTNNTINTDNNISSDYLNYRNAIEALINVYPMAVYHRDEDGRTPLHHVCANSGNPQIVSLLLDASYSSSIQEHKKRKNYHDAAAAAKQSVVDFVRTRTRHERNTALHEICRWGRFGNHDYLIYIHLPMQHNFNSNSNSSRYYSHDHHHHHPLLQTIALLLEKEPLAANLRNRMGITPFYLLFGYWLNKQEYTHRMFLLDTIRFHSRSSSRSRSSQQWEHDHDHDHNHNHDHVELTRRWDAILLMIELASKANSITTTTTTTTTPTLPTTSTSFLYLHAAIGTDRTWPVFDLILHLYRHQCHICGTLDGQMLDSKHGGDLPLTIAARTVMHPNVASNVISSLLVQTSTDFTIKHHNHNQQQQQQQQPVKSMITSSGDSILCCAIRGRKTWNWNPYIKENYTIWKNYNHLFSRSSSSLSSALQHIVAAYPDTLRQQDTITKLYPFMLAAVSNYTSLDTVFCLLKESPDLIASGIVDKNVIHSNIKKATKTTPTPMSSDTKTTSHVNELGWFGFGYTNIHDYHHDWKMSLSERVTLTAVVGIIVGAIALYS